jgi:undecaprenyl-diphosphatase
MKNKKNIIFVSISVVVAIIYTILVKFVDVQAIGPQNSSVGFAKLNGFFHKLIGSNMTIYKITEVFGYILFLLVAIYGCIGLYQLIKRKSLLKVDKEIIMQGVFYVVMLAVYVLFEKLEINYRPILIEGVLEASYPSSHTILSLCLCGSSLITSQKYFNKKYIKLINIITIVVTFIVLLGRIISGVHWISDIIGGILISASLVMCYYLAFNWKQNVN